VYCIDKACRYTYLRDNRNSSRYTLELDEFTYDDLVEMLNDADEFMSKEKTKLKDLKLKFTSLQA